MRVLARLASLAQIGELARRLVKPRRRLSRLYPYQLSHMALKCDKSSKFQPSLVDQKVFKMWVLLSLYNIQDFILLV